MIPDDADIPDDNVTADDIARQDAAYRKQCDDNDAAYTAPEHAAKRAAPAPTSGDFDQ